MITNLCFFPEELRQELGDGETVPGNVTGNGSAALPVPRGNASTFDAERHFLSLDLACQSKSVKIVVSALDCIQVLKF